jgi:uncharacterized protein YndB with AHSA1/START domain
MKKVQTNVSAKRSPEQVYEYLVDFRNQPEWRFDVLSCELVEGETGRVGARYRQRVKQGRREMDSGVELTRADAPHTVAFRTLDSGPVTASGAWEIRASSGGTHVVCDVAIETRGFVRLFEPFMGPSLRRTAERYERDLTERLSG